jgi:hypothetical protein
MRKAHKLIQGRLGCRVYSFVFEGITAKPRHYRIIGAKKVAVT